MAQEDIMLDKNSSLNFGAVEVGGMTSMDAVDCLLDFSKGPELAMVTTANRETYHFRLEQEALNYTVLETNRCVLHDYIFIF